LIVFVLVISTFSCETCPRQKKLPYGNNQPGQSIKMETITIMNGIKDYWVKLAAVQMSQSGQLTLELPYVIIGLGPTPNFVEKLTVGVPPNSESNKLYRTYTQMIPNSQIVVVPSPLNNPEKWHSKLFITPSRMILHTGIALGATLVVLAGALAVFQYREKVCFVSSDRNRSISC
jgi:integrin alpha FG-GAP repeat containing protein 1